MSSRKRNLVYVLLALLFLALLAAVVLLAYTILSFRMAPPPATGQVLPASRLHAATPGPVSEVLIRIEDEDEAAAPPAEDKAERRAGVEPAPATGHGNIPSVCEAYGPQIRTRLTFPNPLTHQSFVSPTRITVLLDIRPDTP